MADDTPTEGLPDRPESESQPATPRSVGPYELLDLLGEGGFGEVWRAEQTHPIERQVALKLIKPGMDSRQVIARFESERRALARMDHPYIAKVLDAGTTEQGRPYFVMEYVRGLPVTEYCDEHRLKTRDRLNLFVQICHGVQHAHQKAIIHRDIKPSNVMVTLQDGVPIPKIIDFGIAKAIAQPLTDKTLFTREGHVVGTPSYMSPEQADDTSLDIDTRSDVYSLGVLLYELLVGALPFETSELQRAGAEEICRRIREEDPPRPSTRIGRATKVTRTAASKRQTDPPSLARSLRGDLDWIVMKALEKERGRRYGSPDAFAADIERHLSDQPVVAGPPTAGYRVRKFVRRHRLAVAAAGMISAALLAGLGTALWGLERAKQAERSAREGEAAARGVADFMVELFEAPDPTRARGTEISAREVLDRGVERIRGGLDDQPRTRARLLQTMGRVYRVMGLYDEAAPLLEQAVEARESGDDAELASAVNELAIVRAWQGDHAGAELLARRALEMRERLHGVEHPAVAESLNALGNALQNLGKLDEAETAHRRAMTIREAALGSHAIEVAQSAHNLAIVHYARNEFDDAERLYRRSAEIEKSVHGENNHNYASSLHTLAILYETQGRFDEAIEVERQSLAIREEVLGPDHPHVSFSLTTLANLYRAVQRPDDAEPLLRRAIEIGADAWDPLYPEVRWMRRSLAAAVAEQQRPHEAAAILTDLLQSSERDGTEGSLPPTLNALGELYAKMGRLADAERLFRRSLAIDEKFEGPDSPYLATALAGLGVVHRDRGDLDAAIASFERALGVVDGEVHENDPELVRLRADYTDSLERAGRASD